MANITILPFSVLHTQRCQNLYAPNRTTSHNSYLQSNHIGNDEAFIILSINIIILMMLSASTIDIAISYNHYRNKAISIIISCLMGAMVCSSQWIKVEDPLLPTADKYMIPAFSNDSVFIIGGLDVATVVSEYVISDNIMYDRGSIIAPDSIWCAGQCHTQFGNTLRLLSAERTEIYVYNLEEKNFVYYYPDSIIIPEGVKYGTGNCLTSNEDYLFIIGGWGTTVDKAVQVLILDTNTWFNGTSLTNSRVNHGCMVTANFVYVFGSIYTASNSVDKIAINDIETGSWTRIGMLTDSLHSMGSVLYDNLIWIIGGAIRQFYAQWVDEPQDYIHTINIINDSVALRTDRLPYAVYGAATIIANDILYVFGGAINNNGEVKTNTWMKYYLIPQTTTSPSTQPTSDPTSNPSVIPTMNPSFILSSAISETTPNPSVIPTNSPTKNPTFIPIIASMMNSSSFSTTDYDTAGLTYGPSVSEQYNTKSTDDNDNEGPIEQTKESLGIVFVLVIIATFCTIVITAAGIVYMILKIKRLKRSKQHVKQMKHDVTECVERNIDSASRVECAGTEEDVVLTNTITRGAVDIKDNVTDTVRFVNGAVNNEIGEREHDVTNAMSFVNAAVNDEVVEDEDDVTIGATAK